MAKFEKMISMNTTSTKMIGTILEVKSSTNPDAVVVSSSVPSSKSIEENETVNEKQLSVVQERRAAFEKRKASYRRTKRQLSKDLEFTIEHLKKIELNQSR